MPNPMRRNSALRANVACAEAYLVLSQRGQVATAFFLPNEQLGVSISCMVGGWPAKQKKRQGKKWSVYGVALSRQIVG